MTGGGDTADVAAAACPDAVFDRGDGGSRGAGDRFDRRPAQQPGTLLVIPPRCTWLSDSRCRGVSPAHEHSRRALANRWTSPISAMNTAREHRADPGDLLGSPRSRDHP